MIIQAHYLSNFPNNKKVRQEVTMEGDGCNCSTVVVSPIFEGLSLLQRQRIVLAVVSEEIKSGELHALSVKTYTPEER